VFVKPVSGWSNVAAQQQTAELTASDGSDDDRLGAAVALSGDGSTLVAGAFQAHVSASGFSKQGKVYVFVKPAGGWTTTNQETAQLTAQDGQQDDRLGEAVAVSSDGATVVAGAYQAKVGSNIPGKVYLFNRPGAGWTTGTAQAEFTAADGASGDRLGWSVATSSDASTIVAGADFAGTNPQQGAAYVFAAANTGGSPPAGFPVGVGSVGGGSAPSGGGGGGGGGGAPAMGGESVSPSSFPASPGGPSAQDSRLRKYGTKVTFTLTNEAATVRFTVQQTRPGRKVKHGRRTTCNRPTRKNAKRKRCTRIVTLAGSFTRAGMVGANRFRFTGRLNRRSLAPGRYTLVATPTANGKTGRAVKASFKIIR
jgi:hypothetical protein